MNAEVTVLGHTQTARTDAQGGFVLSPDPRPPFELLVVLPGGRYARPILVTAIPPDGALRVEVATVVTESVSVTAGAAPGIQTTPANGAALVTRDDLQSRQPGNLSQALENVAGVSNVSEGQASVPAIRGLAQGRSLVLIDGARVTAERRAGPSATFLDPFLLEGVEVSRGPGSVAYGSDAFGGVIHARTRRPEPGGELGFGFTGLVGGGAPQTRAGVDVQTGLSERSAALVSAHVRESDDYSSPEGEVPNSGASDRGVLLRYAHRMGPGLFSAGLQIDEGREIGRPRTDSASVRFYYPLEDSDRLTMSYETGRVASFDALTFSLFTGRSRVVTDQDRFATETEPRLIERADVSARDYGLRTVASSRWGATRLDFGADLHGRNGLEADDVVIRFDLAGNETGRDVMATIEDAKHVDAALFVSAEGAVHRVVTLAGGLRVDYVRSTNEGGYFGDHSVDHTAPSGFASVTVGPFSGLSVTGQIAHGFRDARLSDRYFRGVTGRGFITGNPDLDPETSDQFDLAARYTRGRWHLAVFAYAYRFEDLIERYEDGEDLFFFRNRGRAEIHGVEVEAQVELPRRTAIEIAAQAARGESLDDDGAPLDDIAPPNLSVTLRKDVGEHGFVRVRGAVFDRDDEPGPNEVETPGYGVVDATGGYRIAPGLEVQLVARNLFDKSYPLASDRRSPLAPGISGLVMIVVSR